MAEKTIEEMREELEASNYIYHDSNDYVVSCRNKWTFAKRSSERRWFSDIRTAYAHMLDQQELAALRAFRDEVARAKLTSDYAQDRLFKTLVEKAKRLQEEK